LLTTPSAFFFQSVEGIRDRNVTGVQTCALPICAVLGVPFDLDEDAQAGLNVYSATPHDFDATTVDSIVLEVEQASNALRLAIRMARDRESHRELRAAMERRTVIDLAVGINMGQNHYSQDRALALRKSASNHPRQ